MGAQVTMHRVNSKAAKAAESRGLLDAFDKHRVDELVIAVVGYAGSGTSKTLQRIEGLVKGQGYETHTIKARTCLDAYALRIGHKFSSAHRSVQMTTEYQSLGDELRKSAGEYAVVAAYMSRQIKELRAQSHAKSADTRNAFLLDSLKHPDEVTFLRHVYGSNFVLVGVGCRPDRRIERLLTKFDIDESLPESAVKVQEVNDFIGRDAEDSEHKYGQQVNATFHLADYFLDNTGDLRRKEEFTLPDQLKRFSEIVFRLELHRPTLHERGMYFAQSAAMRSACLSRQVGASIVSADGQLLSAGTNEVPKSGGGAYGDDDPSNDHRCFTPGHKGCSNTRAQDQILKDISDRLRNEGLLKPEADIQRVTAALKQTRVKSLIEFSRAVHAEMDALLSLVRSGTKLESDAILFSTTYPCHNCARHIVAAGVSEVIYLEPYAKSLAISLHDDSIADNLPEEQIVGRVRFLPYTGVSPRLYEAVFLKRANLKDKEGGFLYRKEEQMKGLERPLWAKSYTELEDEAERFLRSFEE